MAERLRPRQQGFVRCAMAVVLLVSCHAGLAQSGRQAPDPIQLAVTQAMREGRFTDAEKLLTDAIYEIEQNDPENPRLANYLKNLSGIVDMRGHRSDAVALIKRALEIDRNAFGSSDLRITNDLTTLASYFEMQGNNQEAERLLNQALEVVRLNRTQLKSGLDIDLAAGVFGSLATLYITEQRWADAEPLMQEEARLCDFFEEPYRSGYASCRSLPQRLAEVYRAEGRTVDAEKLPQGEGPPELVALNRTAENYEKDGLYPSAEATYNRAIAVAEKMETDPQNHYGGLIEEEINSLGRLFEKEGFKDRAEKAYASALELDVRQAGPERGHTVYAQMLNPRYVVDLYRSEARLKDAEPLLRRVLEIQEKSLGERHSAVVQTLTTLAGIYEEEGKNDETKYAQALPLYERALAIQQANLGPDHPQLIGPLANYADILRKVHEDAKAAEVQARIDMISRAQQNERN